jgi:hypothetical protein
MLYNYRKNSYYSNESKLIKKDPPCLITKNSSYKTTKSGNHNKGMKILRQN